MSKWEGIKFDTEKIDPDQLIKLIEELTNSPQINPSDSIMYHISDRIPTYLNQLAQGQITYGEFESYIYDIKGLIYVTILKDEVSNTALLQKSLDVIGKLLINGAITLMKR